MIFDLFDLISDKMENELMINFRTGLDGCSAFEESQRVFKQFNQCKNEFAACKKAQVLYIFYILITLFEILNWLMH